MAINSIYRSSPARMMGLASGMDTDFLIQQTLRVHQMRIDSQFRARKNLLWKQDIQTSVRDQINSFRNTFLTSMGASAMLNRNTYIASVATATGSNADAVTVKAMGGSATNSVRIGAINKLARGAGAQSSNAAQAANKLISLSDRLGSINFFNGMLNFGSEAAFQANVVNNSGASTRVDKSVIEGIDWDSIDETSSFTVQGMNVTITRDSGGLYTFTVGEGDGMITGTLEFNGGADDPPTVTITSGTDTEDVVEALEQLRATTEAGVTTITRNGNVQEFIKQATVAGTDGSDVTITRREDGRIQNAGFNLDFYGEKEIQIGDASITLRSNMTVSQMLTAVNNSKAGVRLSFEQLTGRFEIQTTETGSGVSVDLDTDAATKELFTAFGFEGATSGAPLIYTGQDAELYINGDLVTNSSNTFTFGGVQITLNRITEGGGTGSLTDTSAGNITINLKRDATEALDKIKAFIEAYNSIIQRIESLTRERKTPYEASYGPLTDEEKSAMSDRQIEEWEAIAKKGLLRNDKGLQNLANSLRSQLYETVKSAGMAPHEIGLTTGRFDSGMGGQIILDEEKLRAALEEDPERVADIFAGTEENQGLLWRMNDLMSTFTAKSQPRTIKSLEDSIRRTSEQINKMQERMFAEEDRLYRQFAAMETALSKMQQQGDWFSSMLGGMQQK